jgi:hypothetical protein
MLARLYSWGRLVVGLAITVGLVLGAARSATSGEVAIKAGLAALTLLPSIGLTLMGVHWIGRRPSDPIGWLSLAGAGFLVCAWIVT